MLSRPCPHDCALHSRLWQLWQRCAALWLLLGLLPAAALAQAEPPPGDKPLVREIFVPFEDLNVLLEASPQRVFLSRDEYEDLLDKASRQAETPPPVLATVLSADYQLQLETGRAIIKGQLELDVLGQGLQQIALELSGVGIRSAKLDGQPAPLAQDASGGTLLLASGPGRRRLELDLTAPLQTEAAQQSLQIQVPMAPISRLKVEAPGNVELKSGADVLKRDVDQQQERTTFELAPQRGPLSLVLSLNNRMLRQDRAMLARSVLIDEIATGIERLQAVVSMTVLHGAADRFEFLLSDDFEVTDVACDQLARWNAVASEDGRQKIGVELRQPVTSTTTVRITAVRLNRDDKNWSFPVLKPLDTSGHVAVLGLMVEQGIETEHVRAEHLIAIDRMVLDQAFAAARQAEQSALPTQPLLAYYAPYSDYALHAQFEKPPQQLQVVTSLVLQLSQQRQEVTGVFSLRPQVDQLFTLLFNAPQDWDVTAVHDAAGNNLPFERFAQDGQGTTIQVRLPQAVAPGQAYAVEYRAVRTGGGWLGDWQQRSVPFPDFQVQSAAHDVGALAVVAVDDLQVRPETLNQLSPLNDDERQQFGLDQDSDLAFRYDARPYAATFLVQRMEPNLTARVLSFLKVGSEGLHAHYEVTFTVRQASTRRLRISLPDTTPPEVALYGLHGTVVKEYNATIVDGRRVWEVLLAEKIALDDNKVGHAYLALTMQQQLADQLQDFVLPIATAEDVEYQSGLLAIEEDAELDTTVRTDARRVDIGELSTAQHRVGRRVLGSYGYVGTPPRVAVDVMRPPGHALPAAIVQRADLLTAIATSGKGQTSAKYHLRTKALLLEIRLPEGAELWSVLVDQLPATPQRSGNSLLVSLPAATGEPLREIEIAFAFPTGVSRLWGDVTSFAPQLLLPGRQGQPDEAVEVPMADVQWKVLLPTGYVVTQNFGNVDSPQVREQIRSPFALAAATYGLIGRSVSSGAEMTAMVAKQEEQTDAQTATTESARPPQTQLSSRFNVPQSNAYRSNAEQIDGAGMLAGANPGQDPFGAPTPHAAEGGEMAGTAIESSGTEPAMDRPAAQPASGPQPSPQKPSSDFALVGVRSLRVDMQRAFDAAPPQQVLQFRSLGDDPVLKVRIMHRTHLLYLAWAVGLVVALIGVLLTNQPWRSKLGWLALVVVAALILPALFDLTLELQDVTAAAILAACLLLPYYLVMSVIRLFLRLILRSLLAMRRLVPHAAALLLAVLPVTGYCQQEMNVEDLLRLLPDQNPIDLPADAVLIPYDPDIAIDPRQQGNRMLIPYEKYVELWNRANPDKRIGAEQPPAEYAISSASFSATLQGEQDLEMQATIAIESFVDRQVAVHLPLSGGVIVSAKLDGAAARLQLVGPADAPAENAPQQQVQQPRAAAEAMPRSMLMVYVTGKGHKELELTLRLSLDRQGGWRRVDARLPMAAAGSLSLTVPQANTEVRLGGVADRASIDTPDNDYRLETAILPGAPLTIQWRPKVAEAEVDAALTAESSAVLDVQEDGLRLAWQAALQFRRGQREQFAFRVPTDYLIEKVVGANVRGWSAEQGEEGQRVVVSLLQPATANETITLLLSRSVVFDAQQATNVVVPAIAIEGTALHQGTLTIRRSPLLDLRSVQARGLSRTDVPSEQVSALVNIGGVQERPLPALPFQSFRFAAAAYELNLEARSLAPKLSAELQAILRISERTSELETQILITAEQVPVHLLRIALPPTIELQQVSEADWVLTDTDDGGSRTLTVYLPAGRLGTFSVALRGSLGARSADDPVPLPVIKVDQAQRQEGQLVVQIDPAYRVRAEQLQAAEVIRLQQAYSWLNEQQRVLARSGLALGLQSADFSGQLILVRRDPVVRYTTLSNVHFTPRAIEETILLEFVVQEAGIQQIAFLLPERMRDARLKVPALRQKTIEPVEEGDPQRPQVRVRLELQDELMGVIRIVVEHDQVLSPDPHEAPLPLVETGQVNRQYVTLQNSSRDEVVLVSQTNIDELASQQDSWRQLADLDVTQGYVIQGPAADARLVVQTKPRQAVQTVGARIGLSETIVVVDASSSYRAAQVFRVENSTEQYLEITLPENATLWSVQVAGEAVKPTRPTGNSEPQHVQIPLVKTETGDADYPVRIVYAGKLYKLERWRRVEFPLARTRNIPVELNQVTLHLPESHRWLDFRGARHLEDQADYVAGIESYLNGQLLKAKQAISSSNEYDRLRAQSSLKSLARSLEDTREKYSRSYASDQNLAAQNYSNLQLLEEAEQQLAKKQQAGQQVDVLDNRVQLQETFEQQSVNRSRNTVTNNSGNFDFKGDGVVESADPQDPTRFNDRWFAQNQLAVPESKPGGKSSEGKLNSGKDTTAGVEPPAQRELYELNAAIQQRRGAERQQSLQKEQQQQLRDLSQQAANERDMSLQYGSDSFSPRSSQLGGMLGGRDDMNGRMAMGETGSGGMGMGGGMPMPSEPLPDGKMPGINLSVPELPGAAPQEGIASEDYDSDGRSLNAPGAGGVNRGSITDVTAATGLASLDLEIPRRGKVYYFSAARGRTTISAQSVPEPLVHRFFRVMSGTAIALVAIWVLRRR